MYVAKPVFLLLRRLVDDQMSMLHESLLMKWITVGHWITVHASTIFLYLMPFRRDSDSCTRWCTPLSGCEMHRPHQDTHPVEAWHCQISEALDSSMLPE